MVMGPRVHKLPRHMSQCVAPTVYINMSSIETAASVLFHGLCFLIFEVIDNVVRARYTLKYNCKRQCHVLFCEVTSVTA